MNRIYILISIYTYTECKFLIWLVLHDRRWTGQQSAGSGHNVQDDDSRAL